MKNRVSFFGVLLIVISLYCSPSMALDPLGPPVAGLAQGQFSAGFEYFYEDSDIRLKNGMLSGVGFLPSFKMNAKEHMVTANIGYGILDRWETFLRLGAEVSGDAAGRVLNSHVKFDGESSFVAGFGTKMTLYEEGKLKLGGLFQMNWGESDGKSTLLGTFTKLSVDTKEISIAVGPSYTLNEGVSVYGGPFVYFMDGRAKGNIFGGRLSYDIEEVNDFGGYIGTRIGGTENIFFNVEYLYTNAASAIGFGLVYKT